MKRNIQITRRASLLDIEKFVAEVGERTREGSCIWLPRHLGGSFFKESRIVALIATAARSGELDVRDWIPPSSADVDPHTSHFETTLAGLAALKYAGRLGNAADLKDPDRVASFHRLVERRSILEASLDTQTPLASGRSVTFCALDPEAPVPLVMSGMTTRDTFVSEFALLLPRYLATAFGPSARNSLPTDLLQPLALFVYELFQNTVDHGRWNTEGQLVPGLRYLSIRKHIALTGAQLAERASGFTPLAEYVRTVSRRSALYEISISDHGLGIIGRLAATRPDIVPRLESSAASAELVNRVIAEALSSKLDRPGAGRGLNRAVGAVRALRGFLSIRTDRVWLYRDFSLNEDGLNLQQFDHAVLAPIAGVHTNLLFPVHP